MPIVLIGLSHHTAPVTIREKFAFPQAEIPVIVDRLIRSNLATEAVLVSTCNRVELYAVTSNENGSSTEAIKRFFLQSRNVEDIPQDTIYLKSEPHSIEHLFRVASGLDSLMLGETEILGQLKQAYDLALKHKLTGGLLNKVFQKAFNTAKQVRTETQIQRGSVSVASAAVDLAEKIFSNLKKRHVLVIGAGDTGEKTARALLSRGASSLVVTNRTYETAAALAATLGGRAVPFESWPNECKQVDIIISSTAAPHYVLDRSRLDPLMRSRNNEPLLLIDIAVPRDIDPEVNMMENVYLYNIDDLQLIADDGASQRKREIALCEQIIGQKVQELLDNRRHAAAIPSHSTPRVA